MQARFLTLSDDWILLRGIFSRYLLLFSEKQPSMFDYYYVLGPCKSDQILMLLNTSSIPECVRNKCENGKVFFNNGCYELNSDEGCKQFEKFIGRKVLLVPDPTTLSLICADEDFKYACVNSCCVGSRRDYLREHRICNTRNPT